MRKWQLSKWQVCKWAATTVAVFALFIMLTGWRRSPRPAATATLTVVSEASSVVVLKPTLAPTDVPTPVPSVTPLPSMPPTRLSSTPTLPPTAAPTTTPEPSVQQVLVDDAVDPPASVGKALVVDQDAQVLRVYEDGVEIRTLPVSTGEPPLHTPAFSGRVRYYIGSFYSFGTWADQAWYLFMGSAEIMIHGAPYTLAEDGEKVYQGLEHLGVRPSSHGCIRLHPNDAEWLTAWNPHGVPIVITPLDLSKEW